MSRQAEGLLEQLMKASIGERPVVWVAHSMGGLLLKHILLMAWESDDERQRELVRKTKAIVFLSTPHQGSPLASFNEASKFLLLPSVQVNELRMNSPQLLQLQNKFLRLLQDKPIQVITFTETVNTKITLLQFEFQCVPPDFANSGTGLIYEIPLAHMDICKPDSRLSFIYQKILHIIKSATEEEKQSLL